MFRLLAVVVVSVSSTLLLINSECLGCCWSVGVIADVGPPVFAAVAVPVVVAVVAKLVATEPRLLEFWQLLDVVLLFREAVVGSANI